MNLLLLLLPLITFAHVIQDDVSILEKSRHSFKHVCTQLGYPDSPLIDVVSGTVLDCMGKKVEVNLFCEKELAQDPYYLRAYVDKETQEVVCVTGKKVLFKYLCVKLSDKALCSEDPEASCRLIQKKLANRLNLIHSSFIKNDKGIRQLNCFFDSSSRGLDG